MRLRPSAADLVLYQEQGPCPTDQPGNPEANESLTHYVGSHQSRNASLRDLPTWRCNPNCSLRSRSTNYPLFNFGEKVRPSRLRRSATLPPALRAGWVTRSRCRGPFPQVPQFARFLRGQEARQLLTCPRHHNHDRQRSVSPSSAAPRRRYDAQANAAGISIAAPAATRLRSSRLRRSPRSAIPLPPHFACFLRSQEARQVLPCW